MIVNVPLYWWYIPLALALLAAVFFVRSARAKDDNWWSMSGFQDIIIAIILGGAAVASIVTGLIK